jgi:hypothetical protein
LPFDEFAIDIESQLLVHGIFLSDVLRAEARFAIAPAIPHSTARPGSVPCGCRVRVAFDERIFVGLALSPPRRRAAPSLGANFVVPTWRGALSKCGFSGRK